MLINATQAVSLKVVANYLEGEVASTEEVTAQATVTASAGTYADGVFTAPATAADVTLTVSFTAGTVTKTGLITVKVTAEAPKVTTVTVTLPTTITEASSTAAVVLVKDQFGATMTTGFTTTYAITTGTSTVATTGLVTAGTYSTTASANAHVLTATVTPTTGTVVTGTAAFTVTADTSKPTIVSVQAIDNKNIVVTYNKKVSATATTVGNYSIYHGTTGVTATCVSGNPDANANEIKLTALFTDATQKIVKLTIASVSTKLGGYPAGGLDAVNYRLYVSNVQDTTSSANTIVAASNVQFLGTTTPDSNKPVINAMAYNKGTGTLVITLDKAVTNVLTYANIKFNTTSLTAAVTNNAQVSGEENKISVTVASADKTTISALTGDLTVTIAADAIADSNGNKNIATSLVASLTVPPTMKSASYDEASNTLTMVFSQTLDLSTSTLRDAFKTSTNIQLKSTEMTAFALGVNDSVITSSNAATVSVLLSTVNAGKVEAVATHTSPKVVVAADVFKNTNGDKNLKQDDSTTDYPAVALSIVKDTTKPAVTGITYNESTRTLVFTFNAPVSRTFTKTNVTFYTDKDSTSLGQTLDGLTPTEVTDANTLTYVLSATAVAGTIDATDLKAVQQGSLTADTPNSYNAYVQIAVDTFTKVGSSLKNVAVTAKEAATTVAYTDNVGPYIATDITVTDKVTISFSFDEKVSKTDAETLANYKVWLMSGSTKVSELAVNAVSMTDYTTFAKKTVKLVTASQTDNATYLLEVFNVKDIATTPNAISSTDATKYSKTFPGSTNPAPNPRVVSVKIKDNGNQSLDTSDYIAVTFDRPVKINTGAASTEYVNNCFALTANGEGAPAWPANYSKDNVLMSTDAADADKVVWIKVDTAMASGAAKLIVGTTKIDYITHGTGLATENIVWDKYSNAHAKATDPVSPKVIESALGATTISEALLTDVDNSGTVNKGDTLKVTFSNPMYINTDVRANATLATTDVANSASKTYGTGATIAGTMTATVGSNTVTITMGDSPSLAPTDVKAAVTVNALDNLFKDSWGIKVRNTVTKAITTATVAAPYITKAEWVNVAGTGVGAIGDYIFVTFNVPVYLVADGTSGDGAGAANSWKLAGVDYATATKATKVVANANQVRLELTAAATLTPTVTAFEIGSAIASNVTNFAGAVPVAATTTNKITVSSDTTSPTIVSAEFISENKVKVVFSKAVNVSNAAFGALEVKYGASTKKSGPAVATNSSTTHVAPVIDTNDTTGKTAIFTLQGVTAGPPDVYAADNVGIGEQTNGLTASTTSGLNIAANNKITDMAGNALVATLAGATLVAVSKDVTAPDYSMLGYELSTKKANLVYTNSGAGYVNNSTADMNLGEMSLLEVYTGASAPSTGTTPTGVAGTFKVKYLTADTNLITGIPSATVGHKIYYRLSDRVANKSAWIEVTATVGAALSATVPDATYTLAAAPGAGATVAYYDAVAKTLNVNNSANIYDVSGKATIQSIGANLAANDTFTLSGGLVSAINAANIAADKTVTLTAAEIAATLAVTGDNASRLTLAGTATGKAITFAAATGLHTVTATGATSVATLGNVGDLVVSSTVSTLTIGGTVTTLTVGAPIATVTVGGAVTTLNANDNITTKLDANAGVATLNIADGKTITLAEVSAVSANAMTVSATGTGAITTLTADGDFTTCTLTVNDDAVASAAIGTLNVPAQATSFTTAGTGTISTMNTTGAIATVTIGNALVSTLNAGTGGISTLAVGDAKTVALLNINAVNTNAMTASITGTGVITTATVGANLTACALTVNDTVVGSAAIGTLNVPAQTTSFTKAGTGTVTTANITGTIPTFTQTTLISTINVNAANTKVVVSAGAPNVVVGNFAGTAIETAVNTATVNVAGVTTAANTVTLKNTSGGALSGLVVTVSASNANTAVTNTALTTTLTTALTGWTTAAWNIGASVATGDYSTLTTAKTLTFAALADAEVVTLTKL